MVSRGASLDRWYLFKFLGFGLMLHRIHHNDPERLFHNHPWSALSLIFGSYGEEMLYPGPETPFVRANPTDFKIRWFFNWLPAKRYHRVVVAKPVWTLVFHLPKSNKWSIIDRDGKVLTEAPWEGDSGYKDYEKAVTPILLSCHNRIDEQVGYFQYLDAKRRGAKTVVCRYLGSGDLVDVEIEKLNPCHYERVVQ